MTGSRKNLPNAITRPETARTQKVIASIQCADALEVGEALDHAPGVAAVAADRALAPVEQRDRERRRSGSRAPP